MCRVVIPEGTCGCTVVTYKPCSTLKALHIRETYNNRLRKIMFRAPTPLTSIQDCPEDINNKLGVGNMCKKHYEGLRAAIAAKLREKMDDSTKEQIRRMGMMQKGIENNWNKSVETGEQSWYVVDDCDCEEEESDVMAGCYAKPRWNSCWMLNANIDDFDLENLDSCDTDFAKDLGGEVEYGIAVALPVCRGVLVDLS